MLSQENLNLLEKYVDKTIVDRALSEVVHNGDLKSVVERFVCQKNDYLDLANSIAEQNKTLPCYVYDPEILEQDISSFQEAFNPKFKNLKIYYPVKINHYKEILSDFVKLGIGLEVASIREMRLAVEVGCHDILYYCPGKTLDDLNAALEYRDFVKINMDSFEELHQLGKLCLERQETINVGIRIHTDSVGKWNKYGIHITDLARFWNESKPYSKFLNLSGIHFHTSRNKNSSVYISVLKELAETIKNNFDHQMIEQIKYIDFGGGFEPDNSEGFFPQSTKLGQLASSVFGLIDQKFEFTKPYFILRASKFEEYATEISNAINKYITPVLGDNIDFYTEPGRVLANNCMQIMTVVEDVKRPDLVITSGGGVNMVGWQRFEFEYFPLINITNPSLDEKKITISGNLCTTYDTWGNYCYAEKIEKGDIILIPYQGTLTYTIAHDFIFAIPSVYKLERG